MRGVLLDPVTGRPEGVDPEQPFTQVTLRVPAGRMEAMREANPGHDGFAAATRQRCPSPRRR